MDLESKNFIVRSLNEGDKEVLKELEYTRPWVKGILKATDNLKQKVGEDGGFDYFEELWKSYVESEYVWVIERKAGKFCGVIKLDIDSEHEAHFYIQVLDDADISGFGEELFEEVIHNIAQNMAITDFYIELWDDSDRSKQIFVEAGYEMEDGCLEISL